MSIAPRLTRLSKPAPLLVFALIGAWSPPLCAQHIADLQWRKGARGALEVALVAPALRAEAQWRPLFSWLANFQEKGGTVPLANALAGMSPEYLLPLLWHGPGGAAATPDATSRLEKLGLGTAVVSMGPSEGELVDLLRVAHLGRQPWMVSTMALRGYAQDPLVASSVREAALGELAARRQLLGLPMPVSRLDSRDSSRPLPRIPAGCIWWFAIDCSRLGPIERVWQARRHWAVGIAGAQLLEWGGAHSAENLVQMQSWIDGAGQMPVELAERIGNWRIDRLLVSKYPVPFGWCLTMEGAFDAPRLAAMLVAAGATEVRPSSGAFTGGVLRIGEWSVAVQPDSLVIAPVEIASRELTDLGERFRKLASKGPAFGCWGEQASLGIAALTATDGSWFLDGRQLQVEISAGDLARAAKQLQDDLPSFGYESDRILSGDLTMLDLVQLEPGVRESDRGEVACRRLVSAARVMVRDSVLVVTVDLNTLPELDLVRLLGRWPGEWLEVLRR